MFHYSIVIVTVCFAMKCLILYDFILFSYRGDFNSTQYVCAWIFMEFLFLGAAFFVVMWREELMILFTHLETDRDVQTQTCSPTDHYRH